MDFSKIHPAYIVPNNQHVKNTTVNKKYHLGAVPIVLFTLLICILYLNIAMLMVS